MRRTLHVATLFLTCGLLGSACLLDAGPYGNSGGGGAGGTTVPTGGTGGTGGMTTGGGGVVIDPNCGNGTKEGVEECDLGAANSNTGDCTVTCKNPTCGDGFVQDGHQEECDNGAANSDISACTNACKTARCGDDLVQAGVEECDKGAENSDTGVCTSMCKAAICGDGLVYAGVETCDGAGVVDKGCDATCHTVCGDGFIAGPETCEDGNGNSGDGCSKDCTIEVGTCGNGRVDPDEACDGVGAGCSADCKTITAGTSCGDAPMIPPGAADPGTGVIFTEYPGDTSMGTLGNGEVLDPGCTMVHKPRLYTYKTGPRGSIVTLETKAGADTFTDTVVWAYRDCLGKKAEEGCNNDIDNGGGNLYSKFQTGYLPPHTTLYIVVAGQADAFLGKFILDVTEQPVKLLFGTTFDADVANMIASDVGGDNAAWKYCDSAGNCGMNSTASWSGKGHALASDNPDKNLNGETLTSAPLNASQLGKVFVQFNYDFVQKGGGGVEAFALQDSTDGTTYNSEYGTLTTFKFRPIVDVSGTAAGISTYSIRLFYDDVTGDGETSRVDDLYVYGY